MQFAHDFKTRAVAAPDRILVATDLSDTEFLIPHAIAQAKESGAELTLLHVISPILTGPIDPSVIAYVDLPQIKREAGLAIEEAACKIQARGIKCKTLVKDGFPSEVILETLRTTGADRLIIGTHGRVRLERLLLGSVATELLTKVMVPMCVIGPKAQERIKHTVPRRILHPVSLRHPNSAVIALDIAQHYRAELTLLHVIDRDETDLGSVNSLINARSRELAKLIPDSESLWCSIATRVRVGNRAEEILSMASTMRADLIVLGVSATVPHWPMEGNRTAYKIIATADCPVLTIRHDAYVDNLRSEKDIAAFILG